MKHRHETEIKLAVRDAKEIRWRLAELGFRPVLARHFESNYLFDFPDQRLRKSRCLIRLRFAGDQGLLTYKGAPLRSRDYKIRREIETHVEDGHRLREILLLLGLREVFCYEKFRTIYAPRGQARRGRGARTWSLTKRPSAITWNWKARSAGSTRWRASLATRAGSTSRTATRRFTARSAKSRARPRGI